MYYGPVASHRSLISSRTIYLFRLSMNLYFLTLTSNNFSFKSFKQCLNNIVSFFLPGTKFTILTNNIWSSGYFEDVKCKNKKNWNNEMRQTQKPKKSDVWTHYEFCVEKPTFFYLYETSTFLCMDITVEVVLHVSSHFLDRHNCTV